MRKSSLKHGVRPVYLFASHYSGVSGGAERSLLELIKDCVDRNINVHVIVPKRGAFTNELDQLGNQVTYTLLDLPYWAHSSLDKSEYSFLHGQGGSKTISELVGILRSKKPTLCATNTIMIPWLAYAASILRVPHVWFIREFGSDDHGLKYAIDEDSVFKTIKLMSDVVFCNSKATKKYLMSKLGPSSDIRIVYPYVPDITITKKNSINRDVTKLIIIGQVKPSKGQLDAVKAVQLLVSKGYNVQLKIIGNLEDKDYARSISELVKSQNLDNSVQVLGFIDKPFEELCQSDIALVCSSNEAFGRVTVEAMRLGVTVVGANSGGTAEIIEDKVTGLLYEPSNIDDLAAKVEALILDRGNYSRQAKLYVKKEFSRLKSHQSFFRFAKVQRAKTKTFSLSPFEGQIDAYLLLEQSQDSALQLLKLRDAEIASLSSQLDRIRSNILYRCAMIPMRAASALLASRKNR